MNARGRAGSGSAHARLSSRSRSVHSASLGVLVRRFEGRVPEGDYAVRLLQTLTAGACTPSGTGGGEWHAASGNSNGWQQWSINLADYAGKTVEISIAYVSDWSVQNLGVFIDDVTLPNGTSTSFESGLEGWTVTGPPAGSGDNANNWIVTDASGFPVGASITTPDTIMMGYGFEGIGTPAARNAVMARVLDHLLD
jgi:hypothetical protein